MSSPTLPPIAFLWSNFGPYHVDRLEAAAAALATTHRVIGVELAGSTNTYSWSQTERILGVERITLFPGRAAQRIRGVRCLLAMIRAVIGTGARHVFLCHYERAEVFLLAVLLRLLGRRTYAMIESKFDDMPRTLWRELLKALAFMPYRSAMVGGGRSRDYLRLHGFREDRIELGYDTVSISRMRTLAGAPPAPEGMAFHDRHFAIVARLVLKKNIATALEAYGRYCRAAGASARELHICGNGPLLGDLQDRAHALGTGKVVFHGFVQAPEVARVLAKSLALILPSSEEQWGLVVNEALAMGLPVLCSTNVGARDLLVRTGVNGFIFEPENPDGLAVAMDLLAGDEALWRRLATGSRALAPLADVRYFGIAVARLVSAHPLPAGMLDRPSVPGPSL